MWAKGEVGSCVAGGFSVVAGGGLLASACLSEIEELLCKGFALAGPA